MASECDGGAARSNGAKRAMEQSEQWSKFTLGIESLRGRLKGLLCPLQLLGQMLTETGNYRSLHAESINQNT
eukprot:1161914-Pelagomonas_calceolata.AAC.3